MKEILKFWLSRKIPDFYLKRKITGNGMFLDLKAVILFYFIHPIKRRIAKYYCIFLKKFFDLKIIAITGSSGKSTTKEMIASILKQHNNVVYSYANIDPFYNIPTTILKCKFSTKYLILEMGVEYAGEMDFYLWMVKPDIGVITSINPTHLEFFKSIQGVYNEKIKLADYLSGKGIVVLNKENEYLNKYGKKHKNKIVFYGNNSPIEAINIKRENTKTSYLLKQRKSLMNIELQVLGNINVNNSLAAIATSIELGISSNDIESGLKEYKPLEHRLSLLKIKNSLIIDDTYNNNPVAAKEAIKLLSELSKGKNIAIVFGDMLELGELSKKYHKEIGETLTNLPLKRIVCVGKESKEVYSVVKKKFGDRVSFWVISEDKVDKYIVDLLDKKYVILFKASRSIGLDKLVVRLSK